MKAAIFDLDGTLIDLFDMHYTSFKGTIKDYTGLDFTREDFIAGYGLKGEEIISNFLEREGASTDDLDEMGEERRRRAMGEVGEVPVLPGVRGIIDELKISGIKLAVGTSARRNMALRVLSAAGLLASFDAVVAIDDVANGKPAPDIFLKAAMDVGADPKECVVFEDSPYGIQAAKAAGMKSVGVLYGSHTPEQLRKINADLTVESFTDIDNTVLKTLFLDLK